MNTFDDGLPNIDNLAEEWNHSTPLALPLIEGVLRQGHKMLIAGPSKAGKSFSLIELAICIAEGEPWLGFQCKQGKVLYVNLELDRASCLHRFKSLYDAMQLNARNHKSITVWNLRGCNLSLQKLTDALIARIKRQNYHIVILDPIYKVMEGRENSAYDTTQMCNQFDRICAELGCAFIYCHHHSKGDQSWKKSTDRAAGSGVFARDADALLDMTELELPQCRRRDGITAWRVTGTLREFVAFPPVDVWFDYPLHVIEHFDTKEVAPHHELQPHQRAMNARKSKEQKLKERKRRLEAAYDICSADGPVTISILAEYLGVTNQSVRNSVDEHPLFTRENGVITRVSRT
jgi:RecA-family ATPase